MPELLFFVPCEKAIVDKNGALSVISILGKLSIGVPPGSPPFPPNAMLPIRWAFVSLWNQASEWERDKTFQFRVTVVSEAGTNLMDSTVDVRFTTPQLHQIVMEVLGMPTTAIGSNRLKICVREKTDSPKEWREAGSFPFVVELVPAPPPDALN